MKKTFTYIVMALIFVGAGMTASAQVNPWNNVTSSVYPLKAVRGTDVGTENRILIPLKWSGTASDTSWRVADTTAPFYMPMMKAGDSTLCTWVGFPKPAKDGSGAATATMYKGSYSIQLGNSFTGLWRPTIFIDSIGQMGTKQRYGGPVTGNAWSTDSVLTGKSVWFIANGASAALKDKWAGCDLIRIIFTKDTTNTAIVWGQNYEMGVKFRGQ